MAASYPGAIKTFASRSNGQVIDAQIIDDLQDEVTAIETGLINGTAHLQSSNTTVANLSVAGNSSISGNLIIGGGVNALGVLGSTFADVTVQGHLTVSSQAQFNAPSTFATDVNIQGILIVSSHAQFNAQVQFNAPSTFATDVNIQGHLIVSSGVSVAGGSTFTNVQVSGGLGVTGTVTHSGLSALAGGLTLGGTTSITLADGDTADLVIGGDVAMVRLTGNSSISSLSGIQTAANQPRVLYVVNVAATNIVLTHAAASASTNQFQLPGGAAMTLNVTDGVLLVYDNVSQVWRTAMS